MDFRRAHVICGGFPPGSPAGHDHDYARLRLLELLAARDIPASVGNDFSGLETWLGVSRLLITYTAGPYPDDAGCAVLRTWLEAGGHWLALHGTSGGRAMRVEGARMRRTVPGAHHDLLGCMFLTHPPYQRFRVDVADGSHPVTAGIASFEVEDEPYFVALTDPAGSRVLLTADFSGMESEVSVLYGADTSVLADGRTRVLGYSRGGGGRGGDVSGSGPLPGADDAAGGSLGAGAAGGVGECGVHGGVGERGGRLRMSRGLWGRLSAGR